MVVTTLEARAQILDDLTAAINQLALATACLGEAYEQLDEATADRLEDGLFRPVQKAYGRAKRTQSAVRRSDSGSRRPRSSRHRPAWARRA